MMQGRDKSTASFNGLGSDRTENVSRLAWITCTRKESKLIFGRYRKRLLTQPFYVGRPELNSFPLHL